MSRVVAIGEPQASLAGYALAGVEAIDAGGRGGRRSAAWEALPPDVGLVLLDARPRRPRRSSNRLAESDLRRLGGAAGVKSSRPLRTRAARRRPPRTRTGRSRGRGRRAGRAARRRRERRGAEIVSSARAAGEVDAAALHGCDEPCDGAPPGAHRRSCAARLDAVRGAPAPGARGGARAADEAVVRRARSSASARPARAQLGPDAVVELDAGEAGGVVARAGEPAAVDYSLAGARRPLHRDGSDERAEELWR